MNIDNSQNYDTLCKRFICCFETLVDGILSTNYSVTWLGLVVDLNSGGTADPVGELHDLQDPVGLQTPPQCSKTTKTGETGRLTELNRIVKVIVSR